MKQAAAAAALVAFGAAEGFVFFKTGLVAPGAIAGQMRFKSFIVMKLFLSAAGASMLGQAALARLRPRRWEESREMSRTAAGYKRAVGGCLVLGCGMALSGCGPTLLPAQLAAGVPAAWQTLAGSVAGAAAFALAERAGVFAPAAACEAPGNAALTSLDKRLGCRYEAIAAPAGAALLAATAALEAAWPTAGDVAALGTLAPAAAWLPVVAGVVVGLNQLPLRLLSGRGQGGSTAVMNIVGTATGGAVAGDYRLTSLREASQLLYVYAGTALGSAAARRLAEGAGQYTPAAGFGPARSAGGGALMLLGARVALGCTCGHGISGMSELNQQSIAAAMAIFAGGIATAFGLAAVGIA